jgi:hypothetical protein
MLQEYKALAIVFAILALALAAYFIKSLRAPRAPPAPAQSVYIQVVPQNGPPVPQSPPPQSPPP